MATALSRSPLYVRGGHLHTNQCSTFTGMILVFGVIDSFRVVFVLLLVECLMWYAKVVQKSSTVYTNFIHSALGATAGSAPQKPRRGCPIGYLVVVLMEGQPPAVPAPVRSGWTSRACSVGLYAWRLPLLRQRNVKPTHAPQVPLHARARHVPRGAAARRRRLRLLVEPLPPDGRA